MDKFYKIGSDTSNFDHNKGHLNSISQHKVYMMSL